MRIRELSAPSEIGRGVGQGSLISPLFFTVSAEAIMRKVFDVMDHCIKFGGN